VQQKGVMVMDVYNEIVVVCLLLDVHISVDFVLPVCLGFCQFYDE